MAWKLRFVRKLQQTGGTAAPNVGFEKIQNVKQMHFFLDKSEFGVETEKLKLLDYEKKIFFFPSRNESKSYCTLVPKHTNHVLLRVTINDPRVIIHNGFHC